jgi:hypothetical protein
MLETCIKTSFVCLQCYLQHVSVCAQSPSGKPFIDNMVTTAHITFVYTYVDNGIVYKFLWLQITVDSVYFPDDVWLL